MERSLLDELQGHNDALHRMKSLVNAISITGGGIPRSDPRARYARETAFIVERQLEAVTAGMRMLRGCLQSVRAEDADRERRAENDRLGIPNCDHLIQEPDCPECNKAPAEVAGP